MSLTNTQLKSVEVATVYFMNQQFTENLWSPDVCSQTDALFYLLQDMMNTNAQRLLELARTTFSTRLWTTTSGCRKPVIMQRLYRVTPGK